MKTHLSSAFSLLCLLAFSALEAQAATPMTFVSSAGTDSNTIANCIRTAPCRTLGAALSVTSPDGEVLVLDSGEYGSASIGQSVSIIAPDGVYAGVTTAGSTDGLDISGANLNVTLKGLTFRGGVNASGLGVKVANASISLGIRDCDFSNLPTSIALFGQSAGSAGVIQAKISDTVIHDGAVGVSVLGVAAVSISHVRLINLSSFGVDLSDSNQGQTVTSVSSSEWSASSLSGGTAFNVSATSQSSQLYIDHTAITGGSYGVYASGSGAGFAYVTVTDSTLSKVAYGLLTYGAGELILSRSTIDASYVGASNSSPSTILSAGNNVFVGNGANIVGKLTPIGLE